MRFQGEFTTLKMVEQNGTVHSGVEIVTGALLIHYLQYHRQIPKTQLIKWLNELCMQLSAYHRCFGKAYQYVNPYAIIICKECRVHLLDLSSSENEDILIYMQRTIIRESFGKSGTIKKTRINADFYNIGKTMQFILAQGQFEPSINVIESHSYSKIIQKCLDVSSENTYQTVKEIQKEIPKIKVYKVKNKRKLKLLPIIGVGILLLVLIVQVDLPETKKGSAKAESELKVISQETEANQMIEVTELLDICNELNEQQCKDILISVIIRCLENGELEQAKEIIGLMEV